MGFIDKNRFRYIRLVAVIAGVFWLVSLGLRIKVLPNNWPYYLLIGQSIGWWLDILIITLGVLGILLYFYNRRQTQIQEKAWEPEIVDENQDDPAQLEIIFDEYFSKMEIIIHNKKLSGARADAKEIEKARMLTLKTFCMLNINQKKTILDYLRDNGLIRKEDPVISFENANLYENNLNLIDLQGVVLREATMTRANLMEATLNEADLSGAHMKEAILKQAFLKQTKLTGSYLEGASLEEAILIEAALDGAYLESADLNGAFLKEATLKNAYLKGASLRGTYLEGADLRGTALQGVDLRGASLYKANLAGANLKGANLKGANLRLAMFEKATMPDGTLFSKNTDLRNFTH